MYDYIRLYWFCQICNTREFDPTNRDRGATHVILIPPTAARKACVPSQNIFFVFLDFARPLILWIIMFYGIINLITCTGVWNKAEKTRSERLIVFTDK